MFLMFIVYDNAVDEEIVEIVKKNADGYTKFLGVQGEGHGEPHLGSHIWPSINNCMMVAIENNREKNIIEATKKLEEQFPGIGIKVFTTSLRKVN